MLEERAFSDSKASLMAPKSGSADGSARGDSTCGQDLALARRNGREPGREASELPRAAVRPAYGRPSAHLGRRGPWSRFPCRRRSRIENC
jgi:hypothetical protein